MKYYTVLIVCFNDGSPDKVGIYTRPSADAALKTLYDYMGDYTDNDNVTSAFALAVNNIGGIYKQESWVRRNAEQ